MRRRDFLAAALAATAFGRSALAVSASCEACVALKKWIARPAADRGKISTQPWSAEALTKAAASDAASELWSDLSARTKQERAADFKARQIIEGDLKMPYAYRTFGDKPASGRGLFISMHGGGNAPKRVNDQQWENQKILYTPAEGVYLAPRAPTNTWNLWHEPHIDRMFDRLIRDLIVFEDVDPNRVYLMGYSAGGDGTYQLAPRMADRFAAASMMAGHPNDASPLGLRNLPFAIHVGALDAGYKRNEVATEWGKKLAELRKADPAGYEHFAKLHEGRGHWMNRQDAEAVPWMAKFTRQRFPTKVVWKQAGVTHDRFYWLAVPAGAAKSGTLVEAVRDGQKIAITAEGVDRLLVRLNDDMLDLNQPVVITLNGKPAYQGKPSRTIATLHKTLEERGDATMVFSAEVAIDAGNLPK
jgi:hypothetical protein